MLHRFFFLLLIALISQWAVNQVASVQERPKVRLTALDQTTQMHMEMLTRLSEIHREKRAEIAALDQQRTELMNQIAELTARRAAETTTLGQQPVDVSVIERDPVPNEEPPSGDQSSLGEPPTATQAEPASTSRTRVLLNYSPNRERARAVAARIGHQLAQNGYTIADVRGVNVQMSSPSIRYFFPEDRSATTMASEIVATSLGEKGLAPARIRVQNFTWSPRKPLHGTLEVWVPVD